MIIVAHGGSGSSHLIRRGRDVWGGDFGERPDVDLKPRWWCEGMDCKIDTLDATPSTEFACSVSKRTGQLVRHGDTMRANLDRILKTRKHWLMSWAGIHGYFSGSDIEDEIVFVVRHPLHQAVSYLHPGTGEHGQDAFSHGMDITSVHGMTIFARFWNLHVKEFLKCKEQGKNVDLWMFEGPTVIHEMLFGWDGSARHYGEVPKEAEEALKDLTIWERIYSQWEI